jgi:hypothetical protein
MLGTVHLEHGGQLSYPLLDITIFYHAIEWLNARV